MAAATTSVHGSRNNEYGFLSDGIELAKFFREYDASVGFRSTFSVMLAAASGVALGAGPPANWDPYAAIIDRISEGARVYRALRVLDAEGQSPAVFVLHRLYGPQRQHLGDSPNVFGDLAPIASLTSAVREARDVLVAREGSRREERVAAHTEQTQRETREILASDFWREAGRHTRMVAQHNALVDRLDGFQTRENDGEALSERSARALGNGTARLADLALRIRASEDLQRRILDAYMYDGRLRARLGALTSTDREISLDDAIRWKLEPPAKACPDARAAFESARTAFIAAVRREARGMWSQAHTAYRSARAKA